MYLFLKIIDFASVRNIDITSIRSLVLAWIDRWLFVSIPYSHALVLKSMVLGQKVIWWNSFSHAIKVIGIQHIFSASGYNLSVLASAVLVVRDRMWVVSRKSLVVLLLTVGSVYLWIVGMQHSLLRAFVMFCYASIGRYVLHRPIHPLVSLFTSGLMLLLADHSVWNSVSFHFSILSTLGIVLWYIPTRRVVSAMTVIEGGVVQNHKTPNMFETIVSEGVVLPLCAQLFVFPEVMVIFGQYTFFSFLANLGLFWLVPFLFLGNLLLLALVGLFSLVGMIFPSLLGWFEWVVLSLSQSNQVFIGIVEELGRWAPTPRATYFSISQLIAWWGLVVLGWVLTNVCIQRPSILQERHCV